MSSLHPIFRLVLSGGFEDGLALYRQQQLPTPEDDRWAGYCLYALGRPLEAKDLLLQALSRGCGAAGAELVTVLRTLGEVTAARSALGELLRQSLPPSERAYGLREAAALHLNDGQPLPALTALEEAWILLSRPSATGTPLRVQTAQLLGYTNHLLGRSAAASHYLEFSLAHCEGVKRLQPLMTRAQVLLYDGHYQRAAQDLLEAASLLDRAPGAKPYHTYLTGLLARSQGRWADALSAFQKSAEAARSSGERSTEFMAELGAATVCTVLKEWTSARHHLRRAARLQQTPWEQALMQLREGYLLGATGKPEAAGHLLRARQTFAALQLPRETGWTDLHLAEIYADQDTKLAIGAIDQALLQRSELESVAPFLPELRLLPRLTSLLSRSAVNPGPAQLLRERLNFLGEQPLEIKVVTLGQNQLEVDGQVVRFGLRRAPEVIAFLLCRGPVKRDTLLNALWPDDDPRKARNYFYQVIFAVKETLPSLQISYDRATGMYRLTCAGSQLSWDVDALKRSLSAGNDHERQRAVLGYTSLFLPEAEAEWAREERDALTSFVTTVGLNLINRWSSDGEYQKCIDLCRRLLAIDPGDEVLAEYLIEAVFELEGLSAAQRALSEAAVRAERELSARPLWISHLAERLHQKVN